MNWNEEKNSRRRDLIEKEICGSISDQELLELEQLQTEASAYRNSVAPLPNAAPEAMECLRTHHGESS